MKTRDDHDLVRRFKEGDFSAFERIMQTYQDRIFNLCLYMLRQREDAQDAAQETFVKVFRNLKRFEPEASLYTWIYRIAVNTCRDQRRKRRTELPESDLPYPDTCSQAFAEDPYDSMEASELLRWALHKVPEKLRAVIVLKEMEGLSYEEIAEVLDISPGTVKSRISRAREKLCRLLGKK
ncbi:MAG: sigma-70 family RNA polymerase sigma factor [Desulfobacteraceae bacterium]|nr:MAG: sigma-70 family RNA polymerase sigma factor [Desulfobacteraceae bacterium]